MNRQEAAGRDEFTKLAYPPRKTTGRRRGWRCWPSSVAIPECAGTGATGTRARFSVADPPADGRGAARRRRLLVARRQAARLPERARAGQSVLPDLRARPRAPATSRASRPASARRRARSSGPAATRFCSRRRTTIPKSKQLQDEELAFRASGKERRYSWDYDPEMEIYAVREKTARDEAPDHRARLRRRGELFARRPVDRVLVDARRLQPHAHRRREEAARGRSELLRRDLHHARRRLRPASA